MIDKKYCMSSYLMLRTIADHSKAFSKYLPPRFYICDIERKPIYDSYELENELRYQIEQATADGKAALALSGGIDSAVLAKFMPKGSTVYTFKCIVPGVKVTDETIVAAKYAKECGLNHQVIEIYWNDFEKYTLPLMKHKGAPIHSIEVQIYKAALRAKEDGFTKLIFGESADLNFGGLSGLLSRDWTIGEFIKRYSYVMPFEVLKESQFVLDTILEFENDGYIDVHEFCRNPFFIEAMGSYENATSTAQIDLVTPYAHTYMGNSLDYNRIRSGENKYLVREIFNRLYKGFEVPPKTPMPRPMNEWLKNWEGPRRAEFWPHSTDHMSGDQKWLVHCLEEFLDLIEEEEAKNNE